MLDWLRRDQPSIGSVFFRGNIAPRAEEFAELSRHGVQARPRPPTDAAAWALELTHPVWGSAELVCLRDQRNPPMDLLRMQAGLSTDDIAQAESIGTSLTVRCPAARRNVLRDRKHLLRYLHAVMGNEGVMAVDHGSELFWTREALDEELAHDADLDVSALYCVHAVLDDGPPDAEDDDGRVTWMHTHGLSRIGAFDFDIINPNPELSHNASDALRALAFLIVQKDVQPNTLRFELGYPGGVIRLVPAAEFDRAAPVQERAVRDAQGHTADRSVVCEPVKRGLFAKGSGVRASVFLQQDLEGMAFAFSPAASELMAERARSTLGKLTALREEFAEFIGDGPAQFATLAKLGYPTDRDPAGREHLWFQVHSMDGSSLQATLLNQPHDVKRLKPGQRGTHPLELLSDWAVMTPMGQINPRYTRLAGFLRKNRELVRRVMQEAAEEGE